MDKEWVDKKIRAAEDIFSKIEEVFREQEIIPSDFVDKILNKIKGKSEYFCFDSDVGFAYLDSVCSDKDFSVEVVGHGIDKITGEPINFVGKQTRL